MPRILLLAGLVLGLSATATAVGQATVERIALAAADDPVGAEGRTLGLSKVIVPAKSRLPLHHHTGTQIARIEAGTLTYTVKSGSVPVYRRQAGETQKLVRTITAGQTARIPQGQWLVEQPDVVHRAANNGNGTVLIYLATLLPTGDPPSVADR